MSNTDAKIPSSGRPGCQLWQFYENIDDAGDIRSAVRCLGRGCSEIITFATSDRLKAHAQKCSLLRATFPELKAILQSSSKVVVLGKRVAETDTSVLDWYRAGPIHLPIRAQLKREQVVHSHCWCSIPPDGERTLQEVAYVLPRAWHAMIDKQHTMWSMHTVNHVNADLLSMLHKYNMCFAHGWCTGVNCSTQVHVSAL